MAKKAVEDPVQTARRLMDDIRRQQAKLSQTIAQAEALFEELQQKGVLGPPPKVRGQNPH